MGCLSKSWWGVLKMGLGYLPVLAACLFCKPTIEKRKKFRKKGNAYIRCVVSSFSLSAPLTLRDGRFRREKTHGVDGWMNPCLDSVPTWNMSSTHGRTSGLYLACCLIWNSCQFIVSASLLLNTSLLLLFEKQRQKYIFIDRDKTYFPTRKWDTFKMPCVRFPNSKNIFEIPARSTDFVFCVFILRYSITITPTLLRQEGSQFELSHHQGRNKGASHGQTSYKGLIIKGGGGRRTIPGCYYYVPLLYHYFVQIFLLFDRLSLKLFL